MVKYYRKRFRRASRKLAWRRNKKARRFMRRKGRRSYKKRAPLIASNSVVVKHRYVDWFAVDPGTGQDQKVQRSFVANGLWDPDAAVGGHQPSGFDFWSQKYRNYVVIGAKVTVRPIGFGGNPYVNRLDVDDQGTAPNWANSQALLSETQGGLRSARFWGNANQSIGSGDALVATWKLRGRGSAKDAIYWGDSTQNPQKKYYFHYTAMCLGNTDAGVSTNYFQFEYIVKWFNRNKEIVKN